MSRIVSVAPALPAHSYDQSTITDAFADLVLPEDTDRRLLDRLHQAAGVRTRHLALPLERYATLSGFGETNDAFITSAVELGMSAVARALAVPKARRATKPTRASKERRLESKKRRGDTKRERRRPADD